MKKILVLFLIVLLFGSVSFAAKTAVKLTPKPVSVNAPAQVNSAASAQQSASYQMGIGVQSGGLPYLRFPMSSSQNLDLGLSYSSPASNIVAMVRMENDLKALSNNINAYWGGELDFNSSSAGTTFDLIGLVGAELMINNVLSIYGNINLLNIELVSAAGTSTTNFYVLQGSNLVYSGIRVYI